MGNQVRFQEIIDILLDVFFLGHCEICHHRSILSRRNDSEENELYGNLFPSLSCNLEHENEESLT